MWHKQQVQVTKDQHYWLKEKAHEHNISIAELIRRLIKAEMKWNPVVREMRKEEANEGD